MKALPTRILAVGLLLTSLIVYLDRLPEAQAPESDSSNASDSAVSEIRASLSRLHDAPRPLMRFSAADELESSATLKGAGAKLQDAVSWILQERGRPRPDLEPSRDLDWELYERAVAELLAWSDVDSRLRSYPFLQRDSTRGLTQQQDARFLTFLRLETMYLREGFFWSLEDTEANRAYCLSVLSTDRVYGHPASHLLAMPVFGEVDAERILGSLRELQQIRYRHLLRYLVLQEQARALQELRAGRHPILGAGWEEIVAPAAAALDAEFRDLRARYLRALARAVSAPECPEF